MANSHIEVVSEEIEFPVELSKTTRLIRARVFKSLPVSVVLGLDFLIAFKLRVDFENRSWVFKDDPSSVHYFEIQESDLLFCCCFFVVLPRLV